ncbi:DUF4249 family protein [Mariniflexile ostreae]|uniref:DUF4249 family protein n=1 Tax=Mariniflexile ostreae TaxID=1520892 RepID=A0ABV5F778_9FLAO
MKKFLFVCMLICSCTDYDTETWNSDSLTVEGQIETDKFAVIRLTNSLPFKGIIDSMEVAKSMETKAKVELFDGEHTEILTLKRDDSSFPFLYYRSNIIKGEIGKEYQLSISIRGKEFLSKTTVPEKANVLDIGFSEWTEDGIVFPDFKDIKIIIDNKTLKNKYFKILIKNEKENKFEFARPFIFNTENIYTENFPVVVSYVKFDDDGKKENQLRVGEIIELKIVAITKAQFDFWKSVKGDATSLLEGASLANQVPTNISNGAFGYWSGENAVSYRVQIP